LADDGLALAWNVLTHVRTGIDGGRNTR
jgi:hypothetical protein